MILLDKHSFYSGDDIEAILLSKKNINHRGQDGHTPLMVACMRFPEYIGSLVDAGADVNLVNNNGQNALFFLIRHNPFLIVDFLHKGLNLDHQDTQGMSALMLACKKDHGGIVEDLIEQGANVNLIDQMGRTALHYAISGKVFSVQVLLGGGGDIDAQDKDGNTALILATQKHPWMAEFLLEKNANPFLTNNEGLTALDYCQQKDTWEHKQLLAVFRTVVGEATYSKPPKKTLKF